MEEEEVENRMVHGIEPLWSYRTIERCGRKRNEVEGEEHTHVEEWSKKCSRKDEKEVIYIWRRTHEKNPYVEGREWRGHKEVKQSTHIRAHKLALQVSRANTVLEPDRKKD